MLYENIIETIGHTPTVKLETIDGNEIFVKLEMFNPGGSVKDRIALYMANDLIQKGLLGKKGQKAVEASSGNTGIGLALVFSAKGIPLTIVMPENMSSERIGLMKSYGAEVILTKKELGMKGAEELARKMGDEGYVFVNQFENQANLAAHEKTTGPEIVADFPQGLDYFVAGIGTAGTIVGAGKVLRQRFKNIKLVGVEPAESPLLEGKPAGPHKIQGIGANFIPPLYQKDAVDEIMPIESAKALEKANIMAKRGFFLGISSNAAILAAEAISARNPDKGLKILALAPDGGIKYMSMGIYGI
jgi:cysteine synthase